MLELLPVHSLGLTIALMVPVAVHEELIFRGLLLPYLRRIGWPWWLAIAASSGTFAVLHVAQGWLAIIQVFGISVVLATFFVLSRSLLSVIAAHFLFDVLQTQLARVLLPHIEEWGRSGAPS
jgi:membrane protease YdiL (CAAX protease family)